MTHFSYFNCKDMLKFNNINFDKETGNYIQSFYYDYLTKRPGCFIKGENTNSVLVGYVMGEINDKNTSKCGYVASLSVASNYRRLQLGSRLLHMFEEKVEKEGGDSVSLHASATNKVATSFYLKNGYKIDNEVVDYYGEHHNALDMVKQLPPNSQSKKVHNSNLG